MEAQPAYAASPWAARRRRALDLRERYPFAAEVLTLYLALLDVQEPAAEHDVTLHEVPGLARELLPAIVSATVAAGPETLANSVAQHPMDGLAEAWLDSAEQEPVARYLSRAATAPFLEALPPAPPAATGQRTCPRCGGPPQLSYFALSGEALVTGPRRLVCARCAAEWNFPRMTCAGCGEQASRNLTVLTPEGGLFPHLRIDACDTCHRYLLGVDLRRDAAAVPVVDELAALPLFLHAQERGLTRVTPNLMGF